VQKSIIFSELLVSVSLTADDCSVITVFDHHVNECNTCFPAVQLDGETDSLCSHGIHAAQNALSLIYKDLLITTAGGTISCAIPIRSAQLSGPRNVEAITHLGKVITRLQYYRYPNSKQRQYEKKLRFQPAREAGVVAQAWSTLTIVPSGSWSMRSCSRCGKLRRKSKCTESSAQLRWDGSKSGNSSWCHH
jgi:hypothetical protein